MADTSPSEQPSVDTKESSRPSVRTPAQLEALQKARIKAAEVRAKNTELRRKERDLVNAQLEENRRLREESIQREHAERFQTKDEASAEEEGAEEEVVYQKKPKRKRRVVVVQDSSTPWEFPPPPLIRDFSVKKHGGDAPQNQKRCARLRGCPSAARNGRAVVGFSGAWHAPDWSRWCQKFRQHG